MSLSRTRNDWELQLADTYDEPFGPLLLDKSADFRAFCDSLNSSHLENPGKLYRLGATPNKQELQKRCAEAEAVYTFANNAGDIVSGGMLEWNRDGSGYISCLFTLQGYEHVGLSRYVIAALMQHALNIGIDRLFLNVFENNDRAIELYARAGFTALNPVPGSTPSGHDNITMTIQGRDAIERSIGELSN